jgi:DNA invertase Pin-like site-specific DNA recombinase
MDSKVDFVCCDSPNATRFTIHVYAALAEEEARKISERTQKALRAYRDRGGLLGGSLPQCRNLTPEAIAKGRAAARESRAKAASEAYADLSPSMVTMRAEGLSLRAIAERLNSEGHTLRGGGRWNAVQVSRVLQRCG